MKLSGFLQENRFITNLNLSKNLVDSRLHDQIFEIKEAPSINQVEPQPPVKQPLDKKGQGSNSKPKQRQKIAEPVIGDEE